MFERFTDRSRRVLVLALDEARDMGHGYVEPEHFVLGLLQVGGVAGAALDQEGAAELEVARRRVAEAIAPRPGGSEAAKLPFSPRAKKSLELALREALRFEHNYIGTEHLLLGLLRVAEKEPGAIESALGVDADRLRARVTELLGDMAPGSKANSKALDDVLDRAHRMAGLTPATTGHLVTAVLADEGSQGAKALASLGVSAEAFGEALARVPVEGTTDGRPRSMEIKVGDRMVTIDDPPLIDALRTMPPEQLRTTLDLLGEVVKKTEGAGGRRRRKA